jgi:transposase
VNNPKIIVEVSSTTNWIANMFEDYDITVAHPAKVRLIAQSVKKTDKIDAHTLMGLYKKDYLPKSYLPSREVSDARDLCRDRSLIVKQRVAIVNKIKYHAFCLGIELKGQGIRKKTLQN